MYDDDEIHDTRSFGLRLSMLRSERALSAREMSLSLGLNKNYINKVEAGQAYPSMAVFLDICDFLQISPKDFFDTKTTDPLAGDFIKVFRQLTPMQSFHLYQLAKDFVDNN